MAQTLAMGLQRRDIRRATNLRRLEMTEVKGNATSSTARIADQTVTRGNGGEIHQIAGGDVPTLTTQQGIPVSDDQNSLRIGERGPLALEDFHFREKIMHFDHERIPERVVHARGFGAHGFFENYASLADLTKADIFQRAEERTPAFVRFSTVAGNKGSSDLARDVRGFAVKLYTKQGNWDLVGNNIPVFFIQDAIKFPDVIHAAKDEPDRGFPKHRPLTTISGISFLLLQKASI
jgi:catalase